MTFEFQPWPKLPRLNREIIITEKIDGTNAAIQFAEDGSYAAQSRKRIISTAKGDDNDNHGFAVWVEEHHEALFEILGPGIHFGEWWGSGIQRGYGLPKGEKRFSLFNVSRWSDELWKSENEGIKVPGLGVVPVLFRGRFTSYAVRFTLMDLEQGGSVAAPGFDNPEGVVVFHTAANEMFKVTIENDEIPKGIGELGAT